METSGQMEFEAEKARLLFLNHAVPFGEQKQTVLLNSDSTFKAVWRFGNGNRFSISARRWETAQREGSLAVWSRLHWSKRSAHLPGIFTLKLNSGTFLCISLTLKKYT